MRIEERRVSPSFTTLPQGQFASGGGAQAASSVRMPTFSRLPARSRCPPNMAIDRTRVSCPPQMLHVQLGLDAVSQADCASHSPTRRGSPQRESANLEQVSSRASHIVPNETAVHARLARLYTQHSPERGHPPDETADETAVHARLTRLYTQPPSERGHPG